MAGPMVKPGRGPRPRLGFVRKGKQVRLTLAMIEAMITAEQGIRETALWFRSQGCELPNTQELTREEENNDTTA